MSREAGPHDYSVFGLKVRSELKIPELTAAQWEGEPDVTILLAPGDHHISADEMEAIDGAMRIAIGDVASFRISGGKRIVVEPSVGCDLRNIRLFLLGSAFGALLHQRALLPLHANAVAIGGKAFAFMGQSGAGKSTLAAWFHDRGHPILADDVCVIGFDQDGLPRAYPGLPRLRLWLDALESSGRTSEGLSRSYSGPSSEIDKYDLPVDSELMVRGDMPLGALYVLERGESFEIQALSGMAAADAIIANTYRGAYVAAAKTQRQHWQSAVKLARVTPVFRALRTRDMDAFTDESKKLLDHLSTTAVNR